MSLSTSIIEFFTRVLPEKVEPGVVQTRQILDQVDPKTGNTVILEPGDIVETEKSRYTKVTVNKTLRNELVNKGIKDADIAKTVTDANDDWEDYNKWSDQYNNH